MDKARGLRHLEACANQQPTDRIHAEQASWSFPRGPRVWRRYGDRTTAHSAHGSDAHSGEATNFARAFGRVTCSSAPSTSGWSCGPAAPPPSSNCMTAPSHHSAAHRSTGANRHDNLPPSAAPPHKPMRAVRKQCP